jgi:AAA15 family ATPase/GTPase
MKLTKVKFINYRSITGKALDIEKDITCIVGINEAGKSNVLRGIEKIDITKDLTHSEISRQSEEYRDPNESPRLQMWFSPDKSEKTQLKELFGFPVERVVISKTKNKYYLESPHPELLGGKFGAKKNTENKEQVAPAPIVQTEAIPSENRLPKEETVIVQAEATPSENGQPKEETAIVTEAAVETVLEEKVTAEVIEKKIDEQIDKISIDDVKAKITEELKQKFIPKVLLFDSVNFEEYYLPEKGEILLSEFIPNPDKHKAVKNLLLLGGITNHSILQATDEASRTLRDTHLEDANKKINKEILDAIWPVKSVKINIKCDGDCLIIKLKEEETNSPFSPQERSRGLQWALAFNIYFLAETKQTLKKSILLIDEPGIFLHIEAQKKLLENTFPSLVEAGNQILYTTHLPFLIDTRFLERIRILRKQKNKVDTIIGSKAWATGTFSRIPEPVKTALGITWSELFQFSEKNVIVEGPSDQVILHAMSPYLHKCEDVAFISCYGATKIPSVLALAQLEERKALGLLDGDQDISILRKKCSTVSLDATCVESISTLSGNSEIKTIEDIIPSEIYKKAVFNVYEEECKNKQGCVLTIDEIPDAYPRVKKTEEFLKNKFGKISHKLLKMDIAREVSDLIKQNGLPEADWSVSNVILEKIEQFFGQKNENVAKPKKKASIKKKRTLKKAGPKIN